MGIEREKFLETLAGSFEAYYDIHRPAEDPGLPLVFRADYHSLAQQEHTHLGQRDQRIRLYIFCAVL